MTPGMLRKSHIVNLRRSRKITPKTNIHDVIFVRSVGTAQKSAQCYTADYQDVFYEELKPLWIISRLFGTFLLEKQKTGKRTFKILSFSVLYSLIFYISCLYLTYLVIKWRLSDLLTSIDTFSNFIIPVIFWSYTIPHIVSIPTHLHEMKSIEKHFHNWNDFEISYNSFTGKPLKLQLRCFSWSIIFVVTLFSGGFTIASAFVSTFQPIALVYIFYSLYLVFLHIAIWCASCTAIRNAMGSVQPFIKTSIEKTGNNRELDACIHMWVQLSKLSTSVGNAFGETAGQILLLLFTLITLSAYIILSAAVNSTLGIVEINLLILLIIYWILVHTMCDCAHQATKKIGSDFVHFLMNCVPINQTAEKTVRHFLTVIMSNPPNITLRGYYVINRRHAVAMLSTMITYLIVLVQFGNTTSSDSRSNDSTTPKLSS